MIKPILAALKHHKTAVVLVALEIALTCAIVTNALFVIGDRVQQMHVVTGVADRELVWANSSGTGGEVSPASQQAERVADLAALRAMPGVRSVAAINSLPLSVRMWGGSLWTAPGDKAALQNVAIYVGTPGVVDTLGLKISEGRDFLPTEHANYRPFDRKTSTTPTVAIVTRELADRLWPGKDPLGRSFYMYSDGKSPLQVVGVVAHLLDPRLDPSGNELNYLLPVTDVQGGSYVLRTRPDARDLVLRDLPAVLDRVDDQRVIVAKGTQEELIHNYFRNDRALIWLLLAVVSALLALTVLGVVGLTSFWVQQRIRSIGIRRAIGATRRDIRRYFQLENLMIVSIGTAIGSIAALLLNLWLMKRYELPHIPLWMVLPGAALLCLVGQLAVLVPAGRAAAVPPVVATRSV